MNRIRKVGEKIKKFLLFFWGIQKEEVSENWHPSVTVLIPAFNEEKCIAETIESVKRQTYPIKEIIVIDDCSDDRTGEIAKSLGVKVVRTPKNTGTKSRALNFGLQFVKTEIAINVDADTILDPKAIENLIPALKDKKTFSASGFVIPQKRKNFWERARLVQYLWYLYIHKEAQAHLNTPLVASGCFFALKLQILKELGGIPEGNIAEDMALTWRAEVEGYKIKFVPKAVCYPKDPSNWSQYRSQVMRWYRGFLQCIKDYHSHLPKRIALFFFVFWYLLTGLLQPVFLGTFAYMLASRPWLNENIALITFGAITLEFLIVLATTIIGGIYHRCLKEALFGFPFYWLVGPIESYLFLRSVVEEWILNRKLRIWEKGH